MAAEQTTDAFTAYQASEAQSARTFALVGLVFYIIGAAGWGIWIISTFLTFYFFTPGFPGMPFGAFFPIMPLAIFLAISIGLTVWSWMTLQHIDAGRYQEAQAPSLVLGILGLFFAWLVGGVFLILAYTKLANVTSGRGPPTVVAAPLAPAAAPQATGRVCPNCGRPIPMDAKFCNHCGHELPG